MPVDSDGDGLFDEDGPDDLNGNGMIEQIRKYVPGEGTHRISRDDPRHMEAVPFGRKATGFSWAPKGWTTTTTAG